MNNKERILKVAYFVLFGIVIISGGTFAYFAWQTLDEQNKLIEGTSECFNVTYAKGEDIGSNENAAVLSLGKSYEDGLSTTLTIGVDSNCTINRGVATLYLNTEEQTSSQLISDKLLNYDVLIDGVVVSSGVIDQDGSITISRFNVDSTPSEVTVYVWLNSELVTNSNVNSLVTSTYKGYISVTVEASDEKILFPTSLTDFVYYLGSEYSTLTSVDSYDKSTGQIVNMNLYSPITLEDNEVLLTRYIGGDTDVYVPDTYVVDGVEYNVKILSFVYNKQSGIFMYNKTIEYVLLGDNITVISDSYGENIAKRLFQGCSNLVSVPVIPSALTDIEGFFFGCTKLVEAPAIPNSVEYMNTAFQNCTSLVKAPKIPDSVGMLHGVFWGCTSLEEAPEIPESVTMMFVTFSDCTSLKGTIKFNSSNISSVMDTFSGTTKEITLLVPSGSTTFNTFSNAGLPGNISVSTY